MAGSRAASASPPPVPAVPGVPVGAEAAASTPSDDPWLGFPASPCGMQLIHFVLVDQGCGVGFVTPNWRLFDRRLAPSDITLSGFDGSVRTSTCTGVIMRYVTAVVCPAAGTHIWNPHQICVTLGLSEATEESGRWWALRRADGALLIRAPIRKGGLVYLPLPEFLQMVRSDLPDPPASPDVLPLSADSPLPTKKTSRWRRRHHRQNSRSRSSDNSGGQAAHGSGPTLSSPAPSKSRMTKFEQEADANTSCSNQSPQLSTATSISGPSPSPIVSLAAGVTAESALGKILPCLEGTERLNRAGRMTKGPRKEKESVPPSLSSKLSLSRPKRSSTGRSFRRKD